MNKKPAMGDNAECEVYRRRKPRNESTDKNRVIGGIGRRRLNQNSNSIREKINHFGPSANVTDSKTNSQNQIKNDEVNGSNTLPRRRVTNKANEEAAISAEHVNKAENSKSISQPSPSLTRRRNPNNKVILSNSQTQNQSFTDPSVSNEKPSILPNHTRRQYGNETNISKLRLSNDTSNNKEIPSYATLPRRRIPVKNSVADKEQRQSESDASQEGNSKVKGVPPVYKRSTSLLKQRRRSDEEQEQGTSSESAIPTNKTSGEINVSKKADNKIENHSSEPQKRFPYKHSHSISKISAIKNRLYEQQSNESSGSDTKYRTWKNESATDINLNNVKNSKIPLSRVNLERESDNQYTTVDFQTKQIETRRFTSRRTSKKIASESIDKSSLTNSTSESLEQDLSENENNEAVSVSKVNVKEKIKEKNTLLKNNDVTPVSFEQTTELKECTMSSLTLMQNNINSIKELKKNMQATSKSTDIEDNEMQKKVTESSVSNNEYAVKNSRDVESPSERLLTHLTGVTNIQNNKPHAEKDLTNFSDSQDKKRRMNTNFVETDYQNTSTFTRNNNTKKDNVTDKTTSDAIPQNKKRNIDNNHKNFQKVKDRYNRCSNRDRDNKWTTTSDTDNDISSSHSSESKLQKKASESTDTTTEEEKTEPNKRKRLKKKRSKRSKTKPSVVPRIRQTQKSFDTSDGDILESNYTSDDCEKRGNDSEIISDGDDDLIVDTQNNITAKLNSENLTSQLSEHKKNRTLNSIYQRKDVSKEQHVQQSKNASKMKSSSLTVVSSMPKFNSFSNADGIVSGSRSEDEGAKLASWRNNRDGPLGSFHSISRVSTIKLGSFGGVPAFSPAAKRRSFSTDGKSQPRSSYSDISDAKVNIKNPFSLNKTNNFNYSGRHSDGEHEITSRLEKMNEEVDDGLRRSYTLPPSARLRNLSKTPFSLMREQTDAEKEESARVAEVLDSLPDSPFSLLGRFQRDTERLMQSRATGSLDGALDHDEDLDDTLKLDKIESNINLDINRSSSPDKLSEDITNNNDITKNKDDFSNLAKPSSSKVRTRPSLPISSLTNDSGDEYSKQESIDCPGSLRRPSYMIAQGSDDIIDPITSLYGQSDDMTLPKVDENDISKKPIWSRPRVPGTLTAKEEAIANDDTCLPVGEPKTGSDSDVDDIFPPDVNILPKPPETHGKGRTRLPLAVPPLLAGIPEERSNAKINDEFGRNRKHRKPNLIHFPEETIAEEPTRELDCDSPKTDERETGYHSQGSDLLSTPNKLSCEDLFSEQDLEKYDETREHIENESKEQSISPIANTPVTPDFNGSRNRENKFGVSSGILTSASDTNITKQAKDMKGQATMSTTSLQATNVEKMNNDSTRSTVSLPVGNEKPAFKYRPEMREHVLQNLLETERSYVSNLRTMINMFFKPLKLPESANIIEPTLVDEIFYQIPEILKYHELFLEQLTERANSWSNTQVIGDVFVNSFSKCLLMDAYSGFISHFAQAKDAIRQATNARPQFNKFIEQCYKEHREKLTLADLLINPVQRIPRYKLLLKDMLKYTPVDHPDYGSLQLALGEVETLADRMNKGEMEADQAERDIEKLRETESTIEGITDLVTSNRKFIRQDLVAEMNKGIAKKDRCLFLFSDLLVCTTVRRRTGALRRGSLGLFSGTSAADISRYKFVWKLPLDNVEITKANNSQANASNKEIEKLEEDLKILSKMSCQMEKLSVPHPAIDASIQDVATEVRNLIQEKQAQLTQASTLSPTLSEMKLSLHLDDRMEEYIFIFLSAECKSSWQAFFEDAKQKLSSSKGTFPPEFQYPKSITKTRSGMQFTCAAPSHIANFTSDGLNTPNATGDIWICSSDGYAGEVCLLSMVPDVEPKATLSVGSSRIICVSAVPGASVTNSRNNDDIMGGNLSRSPPRKMKNSKVNSSIRSKKSNYSDDEDTIGHAAESIIAFDSSDDEAGNDYDTPYMGTSAFGGRMSPDGSSLGTVESIEGRDNIDFTSSDEDQVDSSHTRHNYNSQYMPPKLDRQSTMWLGTEDRRLYVYRSYDAVNQRKSKMKLHLPAAATALLYFENKVIVALRSGELCIYQRDADTNSWDMSSPQKIHISISSAPIVCVTAVAGRIWCGCENTIVLVNATSLKIETQFSVSDDINKTVTVHRIVNSGLGVWVSLQNSPIVKLYHATTFEYLSKIDVGPAVQKMLAGADAIIRQHKAACLRVTALLVCKDLLWIGTSAGVILTNPLPSITANTSPSSASGLGNNPGLKGSPHGHTGHVRFLSSVEVPESEFKLIQNEKDGQSPMNTRYKFIKDYKRSKNSTDSNGVPMLTLVVSGGDGYEDFRSNQQNDSIGRDDSINHLLIWRV